MKSIDKINNPYRVNSPPALFRKPILCYLGWHFFSQRKLSSENIHCYRCDAIQYGVYSGYP